MSVKTDKFAPLMKIVGGTATAFTVWQMEKDQAFSGTAKFAGYGIVIAAGFLAVRGIDELLYGRS